MAEYYGVRHLSPACAYYVREFLDRTKPKAVLIEGPSDLSGLIEGLCSPRVRLPAAILAYTTEAPVRTVMYPMAEFSPEYQAMLWAVTNNIPVEFCDLPSGSLLSREREDENSPQESESVYSRLEKLTGLDTDTFWEYRFEHCESYDDFIAAAKEYGKSIREFSISDEHNELREAYMRRRINETEEKYGKTAVITGAFHTSGIKDRPYTDKDKILTDKLEAAASKATLMPYSYYRLSSRSGYGAGSKAPAYYEMLWNNRIKGTLDNTAPEYLSALAAYQRKNGFSASSAEVIEAQRLSLTLSAMRGGRLPSMSDLRDSAVTCLGHGSFGEISLACADVEIGSKIGELPEGTVCTSVQEDFMLQLKELKLERYRTATVQELDLNLRENLRVKSEKSAFLDLNRSFFLHRLLQAGVHFGEKLLHSQENATWAEKWNISWTPETEIQIVEASLNGDTVEEAARTSLNMELASSETLTATAKTLYSALLCGLPDCIKTAAYAVQKMAADCASPSDEGSTIGSLSATVRYGNIRRLDAEPIIPLIKQLYLKFCLQLFTASICDANAAEEIITAMTAVHDACIAHDFLDSERFIALLGDISDSDTVNPLISGFACALLAEQGKIAPEKLSELVSRRLSRGTPPHEGAAWFEGLAKRNRRSLIGRLTLWEKLCSFISELDDDEFKPVLISLRRTFADFSPAEKTDIAENIGEVLGISTQQAAEMITAEVTAEEQQAIDELDDFDFGDI
ncbi:DUF5682 family protein [Ruminococcus flavefaciens]|uniref:Uncharacterized protein n=1 Tax=Ruminococcus flavefaciens TaxID=1265 RepID=A0A1M7JBD2_RUMFL|nr:DUF5682 family protein [Ruminococcus flavefaciens]SHM50228.1 hypothetical protein SAMN04487860_105243 [Ruminococcus flavefaciens]